ncbi:MAG: flagellar basal body L-ring protein FlgH [Leptospiraceae bacterium]|nr:flagellar basal body L-ring protein FlgH [Leptospiraceae bacterium]MCP5493271.1 flagellar basal body L-ring protein FlgH [Leptospiraceae bacterium]
MIKYVIIVFLLTFETVFSQTEPPPDEQHPTPPSLSLYEYHNPYSPGQNIKLGTVIRVVFKEGLKSEYMYESQKDDSHTIKSSPDKKVVTDIMPFYSDRSIAKKKNAKIKSNGKILGAMSVVVTSVEPQTNNLVVNGIREATFDGNKNRLELSGLVSPQDIKEGRTVTSDQVANLELKFISAPEEINLEDPNVQLKPVYNPDGTRAINPDGTPMDKAELYESEKQKIMLKYIKRMLGESE